jgi:predicted transcriptional regulator
MTHDPRHTTAQPAAPENAEKPDDLSEQEWAEIQEARADLAVGRAYTHEQIVSCLRTWGADHETDGPAERVAPAF